MTTNIEIGNRQFSQNSERPWFEVRPQLVATLATLTTLLVVLVSKPQIVEQALRVAGM